MKVTLIKPGIGELIKGYNLNEGSMEPLPVALIAGLTGKDHDIAFYDDRLESIPYDDPTDLAALTVDTFTARRAYQIAGEYRKRNVRVVLGGMHVTLLPQEASAHADAIVTGDAEPVWKNILMDAEKGQLKKHYHGQPDHPQHNCFPDRSIFKGKKYLPVSLIQFSRGCNFNCSFCSVSRFFNNRHQCRKTEDILYEIEKDKLKTLLFVDDNMVANRGRLKDFLKELIPMKVKWAGQASVDMIKDTELMSLMARSGCVGNLIGFESIDLNTLKDFNKVPNMRFSGDYGGVLKVFADFGFLTWGSFMIGNDFDTPETIEKTLDFAIKNKLALSFFHVLMPYPGTRVYDQFKKEGRLLYGDSWWNHPDYRYNHPAFVPRLMTEQQLYESTVKANKDFYAVSSIIKRSLDTKTNMRNLLNLAIYARFNYVMRKTSV